jgi:hypothetical protein
VSEWICCADQLPEEGKTVLTKIDDSNGIRNEQTLKLRGNLWWFPDGSMYVYYTPTHWLEARDK